MLLVFSENFEQKKPVVHEKKSCSKLGFLTPKRGKTHEETTPKETPKCSTQIRPRQKIGENVWNVFVCGSGARNCFPARYKAQTFGGEGFVGNIFFSERRKKIRGGKKKIRGGEKKYTGRKKYVGNFSVKIAPVCQIGQVDGHRCKLGRQYI